MPETRLNPPKPVPRRAWYWLHWLTWLVVAAVLWRVIEAQRTQQFGGFASSLSYSKWNYFGWPVRHLTLAESGSMFPRPGELPTFTYHWHAKEITFNFVFCFAMTVATAAMFERWLRSPNRWQFSLSNLLGVTVVVAILAGVASSRIDLPWQLIGHPSWPLISWYDLREPLRWPLLLALGCLLYASGWLACTAGLRWITLLRRRSPAP